MKFLKSASRPFLTPRTVNSSTAPLFWVDSKITRAGSVNDSSLPWSVSSTAVGTCTVDDADGAAEEVDADEPDEAEPSADPLPESALQPPSTRAVAAVRATRVWAGRERRARTRSLCLDIVYRIAGRVDQQPTRRSAK